MRKICQQHVKHLFSSALFKFALFMKVWLICKILVSCSSLLSYRIIYARWLRFCSLPKKHESLQPYCVIKIFGRNFLITLLPFFVTDLKERASLIEDQVCFNKLHVIKSKGKDICRFCISFQPTSFVGYRKSD